MGDTGAEFKMITERAGAKVNLTLHVGPPRADGYHPLESLVMFAQLGDIVTAKRAQKTTLTIDGHFANSLSADSDNLILSAARAAGLGPAEFHLTKNLPVASGIGGGSADAAAALRALQRLYGNVTDLSDLALSLGADVPVCLHSQTAIMSGIGETLTPLKTKQSFPALFVNPGISVSTAAIFNAYDKERHIASDLSHIHSADLLGIAKAGRNDLQEIAISLKPVIADVLAELQAHKGVQLSRMSGSGATCFAIFETAAQAALAQEAIRAAHSDWWCEATVLGEGAP